MLPLLPFVQHASLKKTIDSSRVMFLLDPGRFHLLTESGPRSCGLSRFTQKGYLRELFTVQPNYTVHYYYQSKKLLSRMQLRRRFIMTFFFSFDA